MALGRIQAARLQSSENETSRSPTIKRSSLTSRVLRSKGVNYRGPKSDRPHTIAALAAPYSKTTRPVPLAIGFERLIRLEVKFSAAILVTTMGTRNTETCVYLGRMKENRQTMKTNAECMVEAWVFIRMFCLVFLGSDRREPSRDRRRARLDRDETGVRKSHWSLNGRETWIRSPLRCFCPLPLREWESLTSPQSET